MLIYCPDMVPTDVLTNKLSGFGYDHLRLVQKESLWECLSKPALQGAFLFLHHLSLHPDNHCAKERCSLSPSDARK